MARETDFLDLYKILGLNPGCGLAEFKHAYRRRVAVLHPDRRAGEHTDAVAAERLQQLTALYGAAMEFERRHGRLPGASPVRPLRTETTSPAAPPLSTTHPPPPRSRWLLVASTAIVCIVWLLRGSEWLPGSDKTETAAVTSPLPASGGDMPNRRGSIPSPMLKLGMDADVVRSIEGNPELSGGDLWEYGPSWIRFENGKMVDWYSSPLHPLKTTTAHPSSRRD